MKIVVLNESTVKVQVKASHLDKIRKPVDRFHRDPDMTRNGSWIVRGPGGWTTISAFGASAPDKLMADLLGLETAELSAESN
jgi:hypothetical protein